MQIQIFSVNTNSLSDVSIDNISETCTSFRSTRLLPSLTGAAISIDPSEGSTISVLVGASQYDIQYDLESLSCKGRKVVGFWLKFKLPAGTSSILFIDCNKRSWRGFKR